MKQLILPTLAATLLLFSACTKQPAPDTKPKINPNLPKVTVNGHIESMSIIAFEWKPIKSPEVKGYYIYRNAPEDKNKQLSRTDQVKSRFSSHYTDTKLMPNTTYIYRISSYNAEYEESEASTTYRVTTKPVLSSVSFFDSIENLPRMAKLIWRPHDNFGVKGYLLERQTIEKPEWTQIAEIDNRLQAEYIDYDLDDNRVYKYRLRAITYNNIKSTPSDIAKVVTKPLPTEIKGLVATTTEPKSITVSWKASEEKDIAYYNVYRSSENKGSYDYYMKLHDTRFSDAIKKDGKSYFYKITAIDTDDLEGLKQINPVQGNSLTKPITPTFLDALVKKDSAVLSWKNNDTRSKTYTLVKVTQEGWMSTTSVEIRDIKETTYTVKGLKPDTKYTFKVMSVDSNKINSEPTLPVDVLITVKK